MTKNDLNPDELLQEISDLKHNQEILEENMNDMANKYKALSWDLLEAYEDSSGITLDKLKELSTILSDMAATNPLMKRAAQMRHGYVFGKGMVFRGIDKKPKVTKVVDDVMNERLLFSVQAYEELNLAKFTDGNVFIVFDTRAKTFTRVPMSEIDAIETDPDSSERIWHIKRTWTSNNQTRSMWYRVSTYESSTDRRKTIKKVPVAQNAVMFHEAANKQIGWTLGVPDSLAAMSWAIAYSNYLNNNSALVKAYAKFAFKVTQNTRKGAEGAAVKIATPGVGGTAIQPVGTELTPVNASGSQVNFNNGQPLAAMVATSLGVSVIALLSSPGAAGGSYGAAATLDQPTLIGMIALQDTWGLFYRNLLRYLGAKDAEVEFPAIESDPTYRAIASLVNAYVSGGLHQKEFRDAVLDLLDIRTIEEDLPKVDAFNNGVPVGSKGGAARTDPVSRQGNQGAQDGGNSQGDTDNEGRTDTISGNS